MTETRTSASHPIRIDSDDRQTVGVTFLAGRVDRSSDGHRWQRDLEASLAGLARAGATTLVCLLESDAEIACDGGRP